MNPSPPIPVTEADQLPQSKPLGVDCDQRMVRPSWKRPKSELDKESLVKFRATTTAEALPNASFRLAHLTDADAQFTRLLDHLQSMGIPMGSETWATKALNRIRHLEDIHRATMRLLREYKGTEEVERLREDIAHARKMLVKATPAMQTMCDCCGWPGARAVGNGWAACEDCLPNRSSPAADRRPMKPNSKQYPSGGRLRRLVLWLREPDRPSLAWHLEVPRWKSCLIDWGRIFTLGIWRP